MEDERETILAHFLTLRLLHYRRSHLSTTMSLGADAVESEGGTLTTRALLRACLFVHLQYVPLSVCVCILICTVCLYLHASRSRHETPPPHIFPSLVSSLIGFLPH